MQILCNLSALLFALHQSVEEVETETGKPKHCFVFSGIATRLTNIVPQQAVRIMKLTAIILLVACLQVQATGYGQKVTLALKDAPLEKLFAEIKKQTGYKFLYINKLVQHAQKITIQVKDAPVEDVLEQCLREQPFGYEIKEKTIVITPKSRLPGTIQQELTLPNPKEIRGIITDENGAPAHEVNIMVKGKGKGTTTNLKGEFMLKDVDENAVLLITSVGYDRQEISVKNKTFVTAQLKVAVGNLDELQVIAYGNTSKRLNTGNVSTLKASDIQKQPISNPLLALQGRVPGVFIEQNNGLPGGGVTVRIQGVNSISSGNNPLFIIDGVPYPQNLFLSPSNILGRSGDNANGNPLNYINPADIESIDILKDADATAIYGSRAANGAILITTKKGKSGKTKVDFILQNGWGKLNKMLDLLNTEEYLEMRDEALSNDNVTVKPTDGNYDVNGVWDKSRYTNWQKVLIGGTAKYMDANLSVSGGSANTNFLIGTGYHRETTVFPGDLSDQKSSVHFSMNHTSINKKFQLQIGGLYQTDKNTLIGRDLTPYAVTLPPNAPSIFNADGTLNWAQLPNGTSTWNNPLAYLNEKYTRKTNNLISNATIGYQLLPGFTLKSNFGYTNMQIGEIVVVPLSVISPERRPTGTRRSNFSNASINSWIIEPQATFHHKIFGGITEMLIGATLTRQDRNQQRLSATGFNSDQVMEDIFSAPTVRPVSSEASTYRYNALFGRVNYNWQNKYIFNLSCRRDGSSRFGSENLFHNFGAIGAAWIFSSEKFIQKNLSFLSFGKIRASYGTTGNDQIGDYKFLNLYNAVNPVVPYGGASGLDPVGIPNPYLEWEETKKIQAGLDLGFWSDRIVINANYFFNRSSNQLQTYALPSYTLPSGSLMINFPATVQNSGWEIMLNIINLKGKDFNWNTNLNVTVIKNKLVRYDNLESSIYANKYEIGKPITILKGYYYLGVDPATGLYGFLNNQGDATSTPIRFTDEILMFKTTPKYFGGFQNNFSYKGFELSVLFQFVKQLGEQYSIGNRPGFFFINGPSTVFANQPRSVLGRWQKPGDEVSIQRYSSTFPSLLLTPFEAANSSSATIGDASYIRLKNLSLSWTLPNKWRQKLNLQNARMFVQGQNLLTVTNYYGMDPETRSTSTLPPLRVITLGLQLTI